MKEGFEVRNDDTIVCWFSRGAASAVAAKKTIEEYGEKCKIRVLTNPVLEEHYDNLRFEKDVEEWLGLPIEHVLNKNFTNFSAVEVWEKRKYMSGVMGAPCTKELKKQARYDWESENHFDWLVLGFTSDEENRYWRFYNGERTNILPVLIKRRITKEKCFKILQRENIKLPEIYSISSKFATGFPNANCIGCVKTGSPTYWNHVRETFPAVFKSRSEQSRKFGTKLISTHPKHLPWWEETKKGVWTNRKTGEISEKPSVRIFLDELPPDLKTSNLKSLNVECSSFCGLDTDEEY